MLPKDTVRVPRVDGARAASTSPFVASAEGATRVRDGIGTM